MYMYTEHEKNAFYVMWVYTCSMCCESYYHSQEVKLNEEAVLDALPFTNPGVTSLSFEWIKNSKMVGDKSVLTVDKVTRDHCDGFYTCEVSKNKQLCFKVHHCLRSISKY